MAHRTDVVVCAHNEEATIADVVAAVLASPHLDRLILVADWCTDATVSEAVSAAQVLYHAGHFQAIDALRVIEVNAGDKGSAMAEGLRLVRTPTVAFIDADLRGLTTPHVDALLSLPPRPGMVVGLRDGWPQPLGRFPSLSGERRVPRRLAEEAGLPGSAWEAEMRINAACLVAGLPWAHIAMSGVTNPRRNKPEEWGQVAGAVAKHAGSLVRMLARTRKVKP